MNIASVLQPRLMPGARTRGLEEGTSVCALGLEFGLGIFFVGMPF